MTKIKFVFTIMTLFVIAMVFNLALVDSASADGSVGNSCTSNSDCDQGLSCQANPCKNGTAGVGSCPAGFSNTTDERVCCSKMWGCMGETGVKDATGLGATDPREMAANVINVILGFLGIIAVILILIGGFMWMTSQGSEEKTGTAKKIMSAGVIGLVIVLAAFGIAKFVVSALITATT